MASPEKTPQSPLVFEIITQRFSEIAFLARIAVNLQYNPDQNKGTLLQIHQRIERQRPPAFTAPIDKLVKLTKVLTGDQPPDAALIVQIPTEESGWSRIGADNDFFHVVTSTLSHGVADTINFRGTKIDSEADGAVWLYDTHGYRAKYDGDSILTLIDKPTDPGDEPPGPGGGGGGGGGGQPWIRPRRPLSGAAGVELPIDESGRETDDPFGTDFPRIPTVNPLCEAPQVPIGQRPE